MAFNVLKDPKDPRNFIVTPAPAGGVDPTLLAAGQQAATVGLEGTRPAVRQFGEKQAREEEGRFGGPGDPRQFKRGVINLKGRLLKKTFDANKRALIEDFTRSGGIVTEELAGQVDNALRSTGGFAAARDVMADFRFMQPDKVAQREADLLAIQEKEKRTSDKMLAETTRIQNDNEVFLYDLGVPAQKVVDDREDFNNRMTLANRVQDAMVLSDHFGTVRFGESTSSEKAAVKQVYADIKRELTIGIGQASEAGALSDQEREFFGEFAGQFTTLAPLQDSTRRVALNDAQNFLASGAEDIKQANRALLMGKRPAVWLVEPRTVDQILARELPEGLTRLTEAEVAVEAERAGRLEAGTLGPVGQGRQFPQETIVDPEGGRRPLVGTDFFEGLQEAVEARKVEGETPGERLKRERTGGR